MKIQAFHAKDGDCLLIRGNEDTVILVDGGRGDAFKKNVSSRLQLPTLGTDIDLVYVSHIDNDHLSGILELVKNKVAWDVFDFHQGEDDFTGRPPALDRPAAIKQIWHNGFAELVDDHDGTIERALDLATRTLSLSEPAFELFELYENLTTGVKDTLELNYRLRFGRMEGILNLPSAREDKLMVLSEANETHRVGEFEVRVLGPTVKELEALRVFWNEWLERNDLDVPKLREAAEEESRTLGTSEERALLGILLNQADKLGEGSEGVTEPNVASLTLLVDDGSHRVLLTGDARSEELLSGLRQHGLVTDTEGLHVDVLKVQHHGAAGKRDRGILQARHRGSLHLLRQRFPQQSGEGGARRHSRFSHRRARFGEPESRPGSAVHLLVHDVEQNPGDHRQPEDVSQERGAGSARQMGREARIHPKVPGDHGPVLDRDRFVVRRLHLRRVHRKGGAQ